MRMLKAHNCHIDTPNALARLHAPFPCSTSKRMHTHMLRDCLASATQSTDMHWAKQLALNLANSTAWGISLELLNWVVFCESSHSRNPDPTPSRRHNTADRIACKLTNFENHRLAETHENALASKVFVFFYVDCFLWFYLLAFFQIPLGSTARPWRTRACWSSFIPSAHSTPSYSPPSLFLLPPPRPRCLSTLQATRSTGFYETRWALSWISPSIRACGWHGSARP